MEINIPIDSNVKESEIKLYEQQYHGVHIKIAEIGYWNSNYITSTGVEKYSQPNNWRELVSEEIRNTDGIIAPEYCMPDLVRNLFKANPFGIVAELMAEASITPFFGHVSKTAGFLGKNLIATDFTSVYQYEIFKFLGDLKTIQHSSSKYEYQNIQPWEYKISSAYDARHLIPARGLMQEALTNPERNILSIWALVHAERIDDYIRRQKEIEEKSDVKVDAPVVFKDVSPEEERKKMVTYGRFPLQRSIREYKPTLDPEMYQLDLEMNNLIRSEVNLNELRKKLGSYRNAYSRIKKAEELVDELFQKQSLTKNDYTRLGGVLMTDRFGWELVKKTHIY